MDTRNVSTNKYHEYINHPFDPCFRSSKQIPSLPIPLTTNTGMTDTTEKMKANNDHSQNGSWNLLLPNGFGIARYLSNVVMVTKDKANSPAKLIIPWKVLLKNVLYTHLHVQNNGAAVIMSINANIKSANAKNLISLPNSVLSFHVLIAMNITSEFPNTSMNEIVILTIPSALSQNLLQWNILCSIHNEGNLSHVQNTSETLATHRFLVKFFQLRQFLVDYLHSLCQYCWSSLRYWFS